MAVFKWMVKIAVLERKSNMSIKKDAQNAHVNLLEKNWSWSFRKD